MTNAEHKSKAPIELTAIDVSPERILRCLFAEEDDLLEQLSECRRLQREERRSYAKDHGLLILPSMTKLREVLR